MSTYRLVTYDVVLYHGQEHEVNGTCGDYLHLRGVDPEDRGDVYHLVTASECELVRATSRYPLAAWEPIGDTAD